LLAQLADPRDVDRAPVAVALAGSESLPVAVLVDALDLAVDPPEAERLVDDLRPGQRTAPGRLLVVPDPELGRGGVVLLEPGAQLGRGREEDRLVALDALMMPW
jgi:hypothetical protein